jgi:predicted small lipoprotein YifL
MSRIVLIMMALILAVAPLSSCGKKGALEPPPGSEEKDDE